MRVTAGTMYAQPVPPPTPHARDWRWGNEQNYPIVQHLEPSLERLVEIKRRWIYQQTRRGWYLYPRRTRRPSGTLLAERHEATPWLLRHRRASGKETQPMTLPLQTLRDEAAAWIDKHYPDQQSAYGNCAEAVKAIVAAFPQLKKVRGQVICPHPWGERDHWWAVDPEGGIIDPTKRQFPLVIKYIPWDESKGEPPRRRTCPDCGESHHGPDEFCSDRCRRSYAAYLTTGRL